MALRTRSFSLSALPLLAAPFAVSLALQACGGETPAPAPPPVASAPVDTSSASAPAASASAAPTEATGASAAPTPPPPPPAPTSTVATTKSDSSWAGCHQSYKAKGKDVGKDVAAMADGCKAATKMKPVGKTLTGKQADQDAPQTFPLDAKANHCYRVYGQASDGIKDLDVVVKDSAGVIVGQDSTDDPSPVVAEDGAVCFSKDDKASLVVSVGMGKGNYALQIWSD